MYVYIRQKLDKTRNTQRKHTAAKKLGSLMQRTNKQTKKSSWKNYIKITSFLKYTGDVHASLIRKTNESFNGI